MKTKIRNSAAPEPNPRRGLLYHMLLQPSPEGVRKYLDEAEPTLALVERCLAVLVENKHPYAPAVEAWLRPRREVMRIQVGSMRPYTVQDKHITSRAFGRVPLGLYEPLWRHSHRFWVTAESNRAIITFDEE